MIYFDTAYLAKSYLNEPGAPLVASLAATVITVTSCELARLEFVATLHRHLRENRLSERQLLTIWQRFEVDEQNEAWDWLPVTPGLIRSACSKVQQLPRAIFLRSADALHLACAHAHGFTEIYTNDRHMLVAASYFSLQAINILP